MLRDVKICTGSLYVALFAATAVVLLTWRRQPPSQGETPVAKPDPLPVPLPEPKVIIHKAERRLVLTSGGATVRAWRIALGPEPVGDKAREGDGRTPEGGYAVCVKNPESRYHLSLGLTYPNEKDAARGLREGRISQAQHDAVAAAIRQGSTPPWDTPLGGEIYIHGGGAGRDWTLGCIALDDEAMRELFDAVPTGTPVTILP